MRVFVFDSETGGLDSKVHSVFSIGALVGDIDTGEIIDQFEALHKLPSIEDYKYTAKAVEIHGITPQRAFDGGISTEEMRTKFMDLWFNNGAAIIGGHNVQYDLNMISRQVFGIEPEALESNLTYRKLDTLPMMRLFTGHDNIQSGASLSQAVKALNIDVTDIGKNKFHAALFDSICTFRIMCKFRQVLTQPDVVERLTQ